MKRTKACSWDGLAGWIQPTLPPLQNCWDAFMAKTHFFTSWLLSLLHLIPSLRATSFRESSKRNRVFMDPFLTKKIFSFLEGKHSLSVITWVNCYHFRFSSLLSHEVMSSSHLQALQKVRHGWAPAAGAAGSMAPLALLRPAHCCLGLPCFLSACAWAGLLKSEYNLQIGMSKICGLFPTQAS